MSCFTCSTLMYSSGPVQTIPCIHLLVQTHKNTNTKMKRASYLHQVTVRVAPLISQFFNLYRCAVRTHHTSNKPHMAAVLFAPSSSHGPPMSSRAYAPTAMSPFTPSHAPPLGAISFEPIVFSEVVQQVMDESFQDMLPVGPACSASPFGFLEAFWPVFSTDHLLPAPTRVWMARHTTLRYLIS